MRRLLAFLLTLGMTFPANAQADSADAPEGAQAAFDKGKAAEELGRHQDAVTAFSRAMHR